MTDAIQPHLERLRSLFQESIAVKTRMIEGHLEIMGRIAQTLVKSIQNGGKILFCGNGGSAADAQHLAAELLIRLRPHVNRDGIPALALAQDSSSMTACGNDYSYEDYYARLVRAFGRKGDILFGITTSGKSPNILKAFQIGRELGLVNVGFLGGDGGPALPLCDLALVVPSKTTGRIQEGHITAGHGILEMTEDLLLENGSIRRL